VRIECELLDDCRRCELEVDRGVILTVFALINVVVVNDETIMGARQKINTNDAVPVHLLFFFLVAIVIICCCVRLTNWITLLDVFIFRTEKKKK
jgi:hypothetical protein